MANQAHEDILETSRNRIERSLSRLAQVARTKTDELKLAKSAIEERHLLSARVSELETENLRLHDQVASLAIGVGTEPEQDRAELERQLEGLKADYMALDRNFMLLKEQYGILQEENEQLSQSGGPGGSAAQADRNELVLKLAEATAQLAEQEAIAAERDTELQDVQSKYSLLERELGTLKAEISAHERVKADVRVKLDNTIEKMEALAQH